MRHREREWGRIFSSSRMAPARRAATCPTRRAATSTSSFAPPASRRTPRSIPSQQFAFYDGGLGSRASDVGIRIKWWRRLYNLLGQATGLGITQNIIDCYADIIRVWQPGDRIYLFGFSRGAYTVRCVAGVLKYCGVPTAVICRTGAGPAAAARSQSARRIATEAVKHVYQHGSSIKGDPYRAEREHRPSTFARKYFAGDGQTSNTAPYFIGAWDTVGTLGAGSLVLALLAVPLDCRQGSRHCWLILAGDSVGPFSRPLGGICVGRAHRTLSGALSALPGTGEPRALSHGVLRHPFALCGAVCPARAGHR